MRFSTYDMKFAAKYIADRLKYNDYDDLEDKAPLIKAQNNIAVRIYERLTRIERQYPNEIVISICRNGIFFDDFFLALEKENIFYPDFKDFNLFYQLDALNKNAQVYTSKNHIAENRADKRMALIAESLERCKLEQEEDEFYDEIECENTSNYNDRDTSEIGFSDYFVSKTKRVSDVKFNPESEQADLISTHHKKLRKI